MRALAAWQLAPPPGLLIFFIKRARYKHQGDEARAQLPTEAAARTRERSRVFPGPPAATRPRSPLPLGYHVEA